MNIASCLTRLCRPATLIVAAMGAAACAPGDEKPMNQAEVTALVDTIGGIAASRLELLNARDVERYLFLYAADPYSADDGVFHGGRQSFERAVRDLIGAQRSIALVRDETGVQVQGRRHANVAVQWHGTMVDTTGHERVLRGVWTASLYRNRNGWLIHTEHNSTLRTPPGTR